jgi:hypothetical protein
MQLSIRILYIGVAVVLASFAAAPVARVISTQPVNVDGIIGPARNFVPLAVGNEVTTDSASAVVQFRDGAMVTLSPHSKLRIEEEPSGPVARVIQGSAIYDVARTSSGRPVNSTSRPALRIPSGGPGLQSAARGSSSKTPSTVPGSPGTRQSGSIAPQVGSFTGSFSSIGGDPQIVSPSGISVSLTSVVNPGTGATTFVVSSIQQTVTLPGGGTAVVTVTSGPLIGATVGGIGTGAITFTPAGSSTPLTSQQTATAVQGQIQQAITTGIATGTLPGGTQAPVPSPVGAGQFSGSGS